MIPATQPVAPMADRLSVATSYPPAWRRLADLPLFATDRWQRAMRGRIEGQPVWLSTGEGPAGPAVGLAGYLVSDPSAYRYGNAVALVADSGSPFASPATREALAGAAIDPAGLVPHLLLTYPGYSTFPVGRASTDHHALRDALALTQQWAAGEEVRVITLPYTPSGSDLANAAVAAGYRCWPLATDAVLPVPRGGFEGYLAPLSRHRRHRVRAERRAVAEAGLRGQRRGVRPDDPVLPRLGELRAQHRARYGLPADPEAEQARLRQVIELLEDRVVVFIVEDPTIEDRRDPNRAVVCFSMFVTDRDQWHALYVAADYTDPRHRGTYFEAAFYLPIETASAAGVRSISYGLGSESAKRRRGCRDEPISFLIKNVAPDGAPFVTTLDQIWRAPKP